MAGALQRLGLSRGVVVHGHGGLDEASLSGSNELVLIEGGAQRSLSLDPVDLGLTSAPLAALAGGDLECNQRLLQALLAGEGSLAQREVVALNSALVLWSAGLVEDWSEGIEAALAALACGAPWQMFERLGQALAPIA
jgi:anthranilate phosphoribosyltransferase